jgi:hypothetical protein
MSGSSGRRAPDAAAGEPQRPAGLATMERRLRAMQVRVAAVTSSASRNRRRP